MAISWITFLLDWLLYTNKVSSHSDWPANVINTSYRIPNTCCLQAAKYCQDGVNAGWRTEGGP